MGVNEASLTVPDDPNTLTVWQQRSVDGETVADLRQKNRLVESPDRAEPFNPRLAYEIALEMAPAEDTFEKYGLTPDEAVRLVAYPAFISKVKQYRDEIVAGGVSFKLKAKIQAEDLLTQSYDLATDAETPASVRADLIKWTAAVAGLGPDPSKKGEGGAGGGAEFRLNITFSGGGPAAAPAAIDVTPTSKEIS